MASGGLNTHTIPKDFLIRGRSIRIEMAGTSNWGSGGRLKLSLYGGDGTTSGVLLGETDEISLPTTDTKISFSGIVYLTCYSESTCRVSGILHFVNLNGTYLKGWNFWQAVDTSINTSDTHRLMMYSHFTNDGNQLQINTIMMGASA